MRIGSEESLGSTRIQICLIASAALMAIKAGHVGWVAGSALYEEAPVQGSIVRPGFAPMLVHQSIEF